MSKVKNRESKGRDAQRKHSELLTRVSKNPDLLFKQLGIDNYKIITHLVEPRSIILEEVFASPDLVFLYLHGNYNLLLVEAKTKIFPYSTSCSLKLCSTSRTSPLSALESQLEFLEDIIKQPRGHETLYEILQRKIPQKVIESSKIQIAGISGTKKRGIRVHEFHTIYKPQTN